MSDRRTVLLAVDGLDHQDADRFREGPLARAHPRLRQLLDEGEGRIVIGPDGPSEPAPVLTSLVTGTTVARTGVATQEPFHPDRPMGRSAWYAEAVQAPTLFSQARRAGMDVAALQWPATAGGQIDLCLPLVEDLACYRNRWEMTERTSSPRMVAEHLAARRAAGVQLSQVPADELVTEIAVEALRRRPRGLFAAHFTGVGAARRADGASAPSVDRALAAATHGVEQILEAVDPGDGDRVLLVPGRPLVPTSLLVHPNATLAAEGLLRTDGLQTSEFRAIVWPDGPRGVVHVHRQEGPAARDVVLTALSSLCTDPRLRLRPVDDGVGATADTDVIAVLEGAPGTVFGLSPTHRPLVEGDDPYRAGPRAVTDRSAPVCVLGRGPGLPTTPAEGSWADLGVTLSRAMGISLPGATAAGLHPRDAEVHAG